MLIIERIIAIRGHTRRHLCCSHEIERHLDEIQAEFERRESELQAEIEVLLARTDPTPATVTVTAR